MDHTDRVLDPQADQRLRPVLGLDRVVHEVLPLALPVREARVILMLGPDRLTCLLQARPPQTRVSGTRNRCFIIVQSSVFVGVTATKLNTLLQLPTPTSALIPKCHPLPLCVLCISESRSPSAFFVELNAAMIVASTNVARDSGSALLSHPTELLELPLSHIYAVPTGAKTASPSSYRAPARPWPPPANERVARDSQIASSSAGRLPSLAAFE